MAGGAGASTTVNPTLGTAFATGEPSPATGTHPRERGAPSGRGCPHRGVHPDDVAALRVDPLEPAAGVRRTQGTLCAVPAGLFAAKATQADRPLDDTATPAGNCRFTEADRRDTH